MYLDIISACMWPVLLCSLHIAKLDAEKFVQAKFKIHKTCPLSAAHHMDKNQQLRIFSNVVQFASFFFYIQSLTGKSTVPRNSIRVCIAPYGTTHSFLVFDLWKSAN